MIKPNDQNTIDVQNEIERVAEYINKTWQGVDYKNAKEIATMTHAFINKNAKWWFDDGYTNSAFYGVLEDRIKNMDEIQRYHDYPYAKLNGMLMASLSMKRAVIDMYDHWNFTDKANQLHKEVSSQIDLSQAKPNGYDELVENYEDFDGYDQFDEEAQSREFKGHGFGITGSRSIVHLLAAHDVAYSKFGQGLSVDRSLVSAVFTHFLSVNEYNNSVEMANEIEALHIPDAKPYFGTFDFSFRHPMLIAMDSLSPVEATTVESYEKSVNHKQAYEAMTDEEKAEAEKRKLEKAKQIINQVKSDDYTQRMQKVITVLKLVDVEHHESVARFSLPDGAKESVDEPHIQPG